MRSTVLVVAAAAGMIGMTGTSRPAHADAMCTALEAAWPAVPAEAKHVTLGQQITDQLTEIGNELGHHMNVLSRELVSLTFDARQRRMQARVGAGDDRYISFAVATDIKFSDGMARVKATIDVAFQGKRMRLALPEFEMMPQSYQGDRLVVLLVPLLERRW